MRQVRPCFWVTPFVGMFFENNRLVPQRLADVLLGQMDTPVNQPLLDKKA